MPNRYSLLDGGATVVEAWTGTVTHDELLSHERRQLQDSGIRAGAVVLADARDASFETDAERVHEFSSEQDRLDNKTYLSKIAILVNDSTFDRARLFAKQVKDYGVTAIVFNSLDIACTWLGVDPQLARKTLQRLAAEPRK